MPCRPGQYPGLGLWGPRQVLGLQPAGQGPVRAGQCGGGDLAQQRDHQSDAGTGTDCRTDGVCRRTSINTTANVGSSTTMEPGTITTGFNMTMLPFIQDSGDIQLQFSFNLSDSPTIRSIASTDGTTAMEMPYTKLRSLSQRVNLRDGQTLVLTGFEQTNTSANKEGTFTRAISCLVAGGMRTRTHHPGGAYHPGADVRWR